MDGAERTYGRRARIIVVVLVLVAALTAVASTVEGGVVGAIEGVIFLSIAFVLGYGVFTNTLETPTVQTAFGIGLAAYGVLIYVTGGSLLWLGLGIVGGLLALSNARQATWARGSG